jgi:hypothetical protein
MTDKMAKGRHRYVTHPKLSDDDVREIRALASSGIAQTAIAARYPVGRTMINRIVRGNRR